MLDLYMGDENSVPHVLYAWDSSLTPQDVVIKLFYVPGTDIGLEEMNMRETALIS